MGLQIEDGTGNGYSAKVDVKNRLKTISVNKSIEHEVNHDEGEAYQLLFDATVDTANNCILYIKNTDEKDIVIEGVNLARGSAGTATDVLVYLNDTGTASGVTTIIPVSANAGSGNLSTGLFYSGNSIASITRGAKLDRIRLTNTESQWFNFQMDVVVPKNKVFTLCITQSGVSVIGMIPFYYQNQN